MSFHDEKLALKDVLISRQEGEIAKRDARIVELDKKYGWALSELSAIKAPARNITAAVDAAMIEMANISPPMRRSECERLIRAALYAAPVYEAKAQGAVMPERKKYVPFGEAYADGWNACLNEVARLNAAPVQQVGVPDGWKLVPVNATEAILDVLYSNGMDESDSLLQDIWSAMLAAAPAAPAADDDDIVLNANAQEILSQCIGAHAYVLGVLANGRPDLAFIEAKKWVDAFKKAAAQMEQGHD